MGGPRKPLLKVHSGTGAVPGGMGTISAHPHSLSASPPWTELQSWRLDWPTGFFIFGLRPCSASLSSGGSTEIPNLGYQMSHSFPDAAESGILEPRIDTRPWRVCSAPPSSSCHQADRELGRRQERGSARGSARGSGGRWASLVAAPLRPDSSSGSGSIRAVSAPPERAPAG